MTEKTIASTTENQQKYKNLAEKLESTKKDQDPGIPFENIFNLEPGSTPEFKDKVETHNPTSTALTNPESGEVMTRPIDASQEILVKEERIEDLQIDGKLNEIYDNALTAFNQHASLAENADPRFSARNGEVAAQYLKIALDSTNSKIDAKYKRNKVRIARASVDTPNSVQQNLIVADRNSILKSLFSQDFENTIKQEFNNP